MTSNVLSGMLSLYTTTTNTFTPVHGTCAVHFWSVSGVSCFDLILSCVFNVVACTCVLSTSFVLFFSLSVVELLPCLTVVWFWRLMQRVCWSRCEFVFVFTWRYPNWCYTQLTNEWAIQVGWHYCAGAVLAVVSPSTVGRKRLTQHAVR